jgi:poly(A) polymerase
MHIELKEKVFKVISEIISESGEEAYVIGGYVRDIIIGRISKDIDIVVNGDGISLAERVRKKLGGSNLSIFKNFGTAMIKSGDTEIEFVGARKESYRSNSRKPVVIPGSIQDDQNRRDFTINTLAICLDNARYGLLIDPFGGINDIKNKIIRTPLEPDVTYSDDPLRMFRAIRFACQLDFKIDNESIESIKRNINRVEIVSKERIVDEFNKIMLSPIPSTGLRLMDETGLLELILPELNMLKGVEQIAGFAHKDNFYHSLEVLDNISRKTDNLWLRWAALLHDIGKYSTKKYNAKFGWSFHSHDFAGSKMVSGIFKNLKLPLNNKMKYVEKLIGLHLRPISLVEEVVTDSAVRRLLFDAGEDIDDLMLLCEADITSKYYEKVQTYLKNFENVRKKLKEVEEKDAVRNWQPPISGEEIMKTFNIEPCYEVGAIKNAIKDAILDGVIENNYESAMQFMIIKAKEFGLNSSKGQ